MYRSNNCGTYFMPVMEHTGISAVFKTRVMFAANSIVKWISEHNSKEPTAYTSDEHWKGNSLKIPHRGWYKESNIVPGNQKLYNVHLISHNK
jgi:hypothetical protein